MYKNLLVRVRLFALLSTIFYSMLSILYIFGPFGNYRGNTLPNLAAEILHGFWIISCILFFISLLFIFHFIFVAPKYKSKAQLQIEKSKNTNEASIKITELKTTR